MAHVNLRRPGNPPPEHRGRSQRAEENNIQLLSPLAQLCKLRSLLLSDQHTVRTGLLERRALEARGVLLRICSSLWLSGASVWKGKGKEGKEGRESLPPRVWGGSACLGFAGVLSPRVSKGSVRNESHASSHGGRALLPSGLGSHQRSRLPGREKTTNPPSQLTHTSEVCVNWLRRSQEN